MCNCMVECAWWRRAGKYHMYTVCAMEHMNHANKFIDKLLDLLQYSIMVVGGTIDDRC